MRIPKDAFQKYIDLGDERSYERLAESFNVSKRAITRMASREHWAQRLAERERVARAAEDQRASASLRAINERHLKVFRYVAQKALTTLKEQPLDDALDSVRALGIMMRLERKLGQAKSAKASERGSPEFLGY